MRDCLCGLLRALAYLGSWDWVKVAWTEEYAAMLRAVLDGLDMIGTER